MAILILACVLVVGIVIIRAANETTDFQQGIYYVGAIMAVLLLIAPLLAG